MKLTNMIVIMCGIMMLLWMAGINNNIGIALGEMGVTSNPTDIGNNWFFSNILLIIGGAAVAGVAISFFTKTPAENLLIIPIVLFLAGFLADWTSLILITNASCEAFTTPLSSCAWITWLVTGLVIPIALAFGMAVIDWWRGRD